MFDFGRNGKKPTHPELLDFLAVEFMETGWSMKSIHRLIVTSATYRQDSKPASPQLAHDRSPYRLRRSRTKKYPHPPRPHPTNEQIQALPKL